MKYLVLSVLFAGLFSSLQAQNYSATDEGSAVKFVIKNFGLKTNGSFAGLQGKIEFDPEHPESAKFDVSVDAATIDTDIDSRDRHLKKEEYFDVEKYPHLEFQSTKVTRSNRKEYLYIFGNITIKGVTKEIKFPFKATPKDGGYLFEGSFELNRRDFGVGGSSVSLSDDLTVNLSVFAKKS